jgi:hypothetical protein
MEKKLDVIFRYGWFMAKRLASGVFGLSHPFDLQGA